MRPEKRPLTAPRPPGARGGQSRAGPQAGCPAGEREPAEPPAQTLCPSCRAAGLLGAPGSPALRLSPGPARRDWPPRPQPTGATPPGPGPNSSLHAQAVWVRGMGLARGWVPTKSGAWAVVSCLLHMCPGSHPRGPPSEASAPSPLRCWWLCGGDGRRLPPSCGRSGGSEPQHPHSPGCRVTAVHPQAREGFLAGEAGCRGADASLCWRAAGSPSLLAGRDVAAVEMAPGPRGLGTCACGEGPWRN